MAPRKSNTTNNGQSALITSIMASIDPLISAINYGQGEGEKDNGQDLPSTKDAGLRIVISQTCQNFHNQCYGNINTNTGTKLDNAKERLDKSEEQIARIGDRISDVSAWTTQDMTAMHWFDVNEARFNFLNEMLSAWSTVYYQIFNETWKPYERKDTPKVSISADEEKRIKDLLARAMARKPSTNHAAA